MALRIYCWEWKALVFSCWFISTVARPVFFLQMTYVVIIFKISHLHILMNFAAFSPMHLQFGPRWSKKLG